jgi:hypothetical protein
MTNRKKHTPIKYLAFHMALFTQPKPRLKLMNYNYTVIESSWRARAKARGR